MRIPRQEDVAILFMTELVRSGHIQLPLSRVAEKHGISVLFLKKVALLLKHAQLITSKEGAGGGYLLARNPSRISVWDIMQAFASERYKMPSSMGGAQTCPLYTDCLPQKVKRTVLNAIEKSTSGINLSSLASVYKQ